MPTALERFQKFATIRTPEGCLLWTGYVTTDGYGRFGSGEPGRPKGAHAWSYTHFTGKDIKGSIDHLCHDPATCDGGDQCMHRRCVEPTHLADVTPRENTLRSNSMAARNARKTSCKRGHPFTEANTFIYKGRRICRACDRERSAARVKVRSERRRLEQATHCPRGHELTIDNTFLYRGWRGCLACAADWGSVSNGRKTHCKRGHAFTVENTKLVKHGRRCRACERERDSARTQARQAA